MYKNNKRPGIPGSPILNIRSLTDDIFRGRQLRRPLSLF